MIHRKIPPKPPDIIKNFASLFKNSSNVANTPKFLDTILENESVSFANQFSKGK